MYYRIYHNGKDFNIIEGVRFKKASVKIIEQGGEYVVVLRQYFLRKIPFFVKKFHFETLSDAEVKYEFLKNYFRRFA
jgi:hypothetical protein